jgi:hypothetical protein
VTSCDVERSFSAYNRILSDRWKYGEVPRGLLWLEINA